MYTLKYELKKNRDELITSIKEVLDYHVEYMVPQGGFYLWCKLKRKVEERKLVEASIRNGVLFMPGRILGASSNYIRLNYASIERGKIREAVLRLANCLKEMD